MVADLVFLAQLLKDENCSYLAMEGKNGLRVHRAELARGDRPVARAHAAPAEQVALGIYSVSSSMYYKIST